MINGTIQYSSVRPFTRHDDGSFGTWREMEKTAEEHVGLRAKNQVTFMIERSRERQKGHAYVSFCLSIYTGLKNITTISWHTIAICISGCFSPCICF